MRFNKSFEKINFKKLKEREKLKEEDKSESSENNNSDEIYTPVPRNIEIEEMSSGERGELKKKFFSFFGITNNDKFKIDISPYDIIGSIQRALLLEMLTYIIFLSFQLICLFLLDKSLGTIWGIGLGFGLGWAAIISILFFLISKNSNKILLFILNIFEFLFLCIFFGWGASYFGVTFLGFVYMPMFVFFMMILWVF